jgi:hypothetical protein
MDGSLCSSLPRDCRVVHRSANARLVSIPKHLLGGGPVDRIPLQKGGLLV